MIECNLVIVMLAAICLMLLIMLKKQKIRIKNLQKEYKGYFKLKTDFKEQLQQQIKERLILEQEKQHHIKMKAIQHTINSLNKHYIHNNKAHTLPVLNQLKYFEHLYEEKKEKEVLDFNEIIAAFLKLFIPSFRHDNIMVYYENKENILIYANEEEVIQLLFYLLENAKEALSHTQMPSKNIYINLYANSTEVMLTIKDNAGGIKKEILQTLFEPFRTTKGNHEGYGLSLYSAYCIVKKMDGSIEIENERFKVKGSDVIYEGAKCTILLPKYTVL